MDDEEIRFDEINKNGSVQLSELNNVDEFNTIFKDYNLSSMDDEHENKTSNHKSLRSKSSDLYIVSSEVNNIPLLTKQGSSKGSNEHLIMQNSNINDLALNGKSTLEGQPSLSGPKNLPFSCSDLPIGTSSDDNLEAKVESDHGIMIISVSQDKALLDSVEHDNFLEDLATQDDFSLSSINTNQHDIAEKIQSRSHSIESKLSGAKILSSKGSDLSGTKSSSPKLSQTSGHTKSSGATISSSKGSDLRSKFIHDSRIKSSSSKLSQMSVQIKQDSLGPGKKPTELKMQSRENTSEVTDYATPYQFSTTVALKSKPKLAALANYAEEMSPTKTKSKQVFLKMNINKRVARGFGILAGFIILGIVITWICLLIALVQISMLNSDVSAIRNKFAILNIAQGTINVSVAQLRKNYSLFEHSYSKLDEAVNSHFSIQYQRYPTQSCVQILQKNSFSTSGYYWIKSSTGRFIRVYCDMSRSCGGITGGWMRVMKLNKDSNESSECPRNLTDKLLGSNIHVCVPTDDNPSCSSVYISAYNITYSKVCGMIRSYQTGTPDGFQNLDRLELVDTDSNYVDGVSLTYGVNPRKHIWTLAAGPCPCDLDRPEFISDHFFCDGVPHSQCSGFCNNVALWDGYGCETQKSQWFYRNLSTYITDEIEMRVCRDQDRQDEDIPIESFELYVQ